MDAPREWYERYNSEADPASQHHQRRIKAALHAKAVTCRGCGAKVRPELGVDMRCEAVAKWAGRVWLFTDQHGGVLHRCAEWQAKPSRSRGFLPSGELTGWYRGKSCVVPGCDRGSVTRDHIVPVSKAGTNDPSNLQPLCSFHNNLKADMSQAEFQALLGVTW